MNKTGEWLKKIFEYDNYRFFLRDYFREQKKLRASFSHRYFANKAGFSSSSFCAHVIDAKRNLTRDSLAKMLKGLGLTGKGASFFEALVLFNQAKTVADREEHFRTIERLRKTSEIYSLNNAQYAYYDEWYYPVIRELAVHAKWNGNINILAKLVSPSISAEKARLALETLENIGILAKSDNGVYKQVSIGVSAEGVPPVITRKVRKEFMLRAIEACENMSVDQRHIAGVTVAMSKQQYEKCMVMLDQIRRGILETAAGDEPVEGVYQFNFQAFPLSSPISNTLHDGVKQ